MRDVQVAEYEHEHLRGAEARVSAQPPPAGPPRKATRASARGTMTRPQMRSFVVGVDVSVPVRLVLCSGFRLVSVLRASVPVRQKC